MKNWIVVSIFLILFGNMQAMEQFEKIIQPDMEKPLSLRSYNNSEASEIFEIKEKEILPLVKKEEAPIQNGDRSEYQKYLEKRNKDIRIARRRLCCGVTLGVLLGVAITWFSIVVLKADKCN